VVCDDRCWIRWWCLVLSGCGGDGCQWFVMIDVGCY
jgi:hypothetical protein